MERKLNFKKGIMPQKVLAEVHKEKVGHHCKVVIDRLFLESIRQ
jgi:hypothetical protein